MNNIPLSVELEVTAVVVTLFLLLVIASLYFKYLDDKEMVNR